MADPKPKLEIRHEEAGGRGAFFHEQDGKRLAEMVYTRLDARTIDVEHTRVDDALRGTGAGRQLLDATVAWARAHGTKIVPTCAYAKAQFDKDPSLADVRA